jgi:DNA adenine methylase
MTPSPTAPHRPALRYHGAKWRLAPWIISCIPAAHDSYIEPFGGSAAVLLRKSRSQIEVYNDLDGDVVAFFRMLRERPDDLIRAIYWTPFAHAEQKLSYQPTDDPLERARRLYVRSYLTISGPTAQWNSGWRRQKKMSRGRNGEGRMKTAPASFMEVEHLYQIAERLRGVFIEQTDALDLIRRYDNPQAVYYVDPPYVTSTRKRWVASAYQHEMTDDHHRALAAALRDCRGMVILSGYDSPLYSELFGDWARLERQARTNGNTADMATECLWLNPAAHAALAAEQQKQAADTLPLFTYQENRP